MRSGTMDSKRSSRPPTERWPPRVCMSGVAETYPMVPRMPTVALAAAAVGLLATPR